VNRDRRESLGKEECFSLDLKTARVTIYIESSFRYRVPEHRTARFDVQVSHVADRPERRAVHRGQQPVC